MTQTLAGLLISGFVINENTAALIVLAIFAKSAPRIVDRITDDGEAHSIYASPASKASMATPRR